MERKLATIRRIEEIKSIEGADLICAYRVDGWWVVGKKEDFQVGDLAAYFEIDSFIPTEIAPFLSKGKEPREFNGVKGEKLRTIRLKKQISQGLLLPLSHICEDGKMLIEKFAHYESVSNRPYPVWIENITEHGWYIDGDVNRIESELFNIDLSEKLNIQKWEPPINPQLRGQIRGNFPSWGRKTDQERVQNLKREIQYHYENETRFEVTIKLDGSSMSVGLSPDKEEFVVCSRNLSLKLDDVENTFVKTALKYNIEEKVRRLDVPIQISGELIGPGIQGNMENLTDYEYHVFDIYDPVHGEYVVNEARDYIVQLLELNHVPVLHLDVTFKELGLQHIDDFLAFAEGPSLNAHYREGVVFKSMDGDFSFKVIANSYLLDQN